MLTSDAVFVNPGNGKMFTRTVSVAVHPILSVTVSENVVDVVVYTNGFCMLELYIPTEGDHAYVSPPEPRSGMYVVLQ